MLDFLRFKEEHKVNKRTGETSIIVTPDFRTRSSKDLMIRGQKFYAVWNEEEKLWSTDVDVALDLIDIEIEKYVEKCKVQHPDYKVVGMFTDSASNGVIDLWNKYVRVQQHDHWKELDSKMIFLNQETTRKDYISKKTAYALEPGDISAYDEIISTLYSPEERHKLEWAIGAIVSGESVKIQKFLVLYGSAGTGKSTILNIVQELFDGYYCTFDAKAIGMADRRFALEVFKDNPLVAIQHDGDLSKIEDNSRINSLVSHEKLPIEEKGKQTYEMKFNAFLFMGTNKPVKITDAKSGLIRRLIDVSPTGEKIPYSKYKTLTNQVKFELGAIAYHCLEVYKADPGYYDSYVPVKMIDATNDMYNYIEENYMDFKDAKEVTLNEAYKRYVEFCKDSLVPYPYKKRVFKEELKNYFETFVAHTKDASNVYIGFLSNKFEKIDIPDKKVEEKPKSWIDLKEQPSKFDILAADYPAQYANSKGTPLKAWDKTTTVLKDIDTSKLHYVKVPETHIVIDFDLQDETGKKIFEKNLEAASSWPKTYAELSKSGAGLHLHYIYDGDPSKLSRVFDQYIEVKVYTGKSSLRRQLTKCNDIPIAHINSGLPLREEKKVLDREGIKSERALWNLVVRAINKEYEPRATKPMIDLINKNLEEAYASGMKYDISQLYGDLYAFAFNSTHNSDYCLNVVRNMKLHSEDMITSDSKFTRDDIAFYDVEVYPNLFIIVWKFRGAPSCIRMINPSPTAVDQLLKLKLVGFNNRRYDNHILYARTLGYSNQQLFELSKKIVGGQDKNCFFGSAYNLSYADVFDFCSKKQSLKKWEIELHFHHQEMDIPWDQPVPEELWSKVAEYCENDVRATEAVFEARYQDFVAREILADLSGLSVNDTTRMHATKIIFGDEKHPKLVYTDLATGEQY